jgi:hypothetical protein
MDSDSPDQPPALSPVPQKVQRSKPLKDLPILEPSSPATPKSPPDLTIQNKDQIIERLSAVLKRKTTELELIRKKLKATEELLQFYQENNDLGCDVLPQLANSLSDPDSMEQHSPAQATAIPMECSQSDLQMHLQKVLRRDS